MSLIITTSKLSENDNVGQLPSENPSNYTNFFRSPITIPPNSEIAVESVKINRTANVNIKDNSFFCHYFGQIADEEDDRPYQIEVPRRIRPDQGMYNLTEYKQELHSKLNKQYGHPSIFGNSSVLINTTANGAENGLKFEFKQRSQHLTNRSGSLTSTPYYNIEVPNSPSSPSDSFTWTPGTGIFQRTGGAAANGVQNTDCIGILKDVPFSNTALDMTVTVVNANADYWKVGLSRPHVQYETTESDGTRTTKNTYPYGYTQGNNYRMATGVSRTSGPEHYDFLVQCVTGAIPSPNNGLRMFCSLNRNASVGLGNWKMYEMKYWESGGSHAGSAMTSAQFYAKYDRIRFKSDGLYLNVYAGLTGSPNYEQLMGANLSRDVDKCFKPRGDTTYALYPQFNIGSGNIELTEYQSEVNPAAGETYRYPVYNASDLPVGDAGPRQYVPGNDMYSCNRVPSADKFNIVNGERITLYRNIDNVQTDSDAIAFVDGSQTYANYFSTAALESYFQPRFENASGGVLNKHVIIANKYTLGQKEDYLLQSQRFPNMSFGVGFLDRAILSESDGHDHGFITGEDTNTVIFTSPHEIDKMPISGFVRIPNLTHQSFNGAQSGISKIIYQVPQFANDGRQYGPLYFAPGEKTYIDLKNPASTILNSLQVQIVGVDEKELKTLTATTQVVFHVRQKL